MENQKRDNLEKAGWKVGSTDEFLEEEFEYENIGHAADCLANLWQKADEVMEQTHELLERFNNGDESDQLFEEMKKLYDKLED